MTAGRGQSGAYRVLYLNHSSLVSGAERSLCALLQELRRSHPEIEPIVALPEPGPLSDLLAGLGCETHFVPLRRLRRPHGIRSAVGALVYLARIAPVVARLARQVGANVIHSNSTTAHLAGGPAAARLRIPSIWHCRDLSPLGATAPYLSRRASLIIAISNCVAGSLRDDGAPKAKIAVIYNGLDTSIWKPGGPSELRQSLNLPSNSFLFGCLAQLTPWKNHGGFIEAAARVIGNRATERAHFAIIGSDLWDENADYVLRLRRLARERGLGARLSFIPYQVDNMDAVAAVDAVVLPSHREPFGRVLMEGMALEKAVVAFDSGGPREIVTPHHDGLLVNPKAENALAVAMLTLLNGGDLARELGVRGRETVVRRFQIAESARLVSSIYLRLGSGRGRGVDQLLAP